MKYLHVLLIAGLFIAGCISTTEKTVSTKRESEPIKETVEELPEKSETFFQMVVHGKEQSALSFLENESDYSDIIYDLEDEWYDEGNLPSRDKLARFYKFICNNYPLTDYYDLKQFADYFYKWKLFERMSEKSLYSKRSYLEEYLVYNEFASPFSAHTEEQQKKANDNTENMRLLFLKKDFVEKADDLALYGYFMWSSNLLGKPKYKPEHLRLFEDIFFALSIVIETDYETWYKEESDIDKLCDYFEKNLKSPLGKFILALLKDEMVAGVEHEKTFDEAVKKAPTPRQAAMLIYKRLNESEDKDEKTVLARRFVDHVQNGSYASKVFMHIVYPYFKEGNLEAVENEINRYRHKYPKNDMVSMALFELARANFSKGNNEKSIQLLEGVVADFPNSSSSAYAWLALGEIYEACNNIEKALESYERAATFRHSPDTQEVTGNIMDASNTRNMAIELLADLLEETGKYEEALKWYRAWEPTSWCGTCVGLMYEQKEIAVIRLLGKLGRREEALEMLKEEIEDGYSAYKGAR